MEKFIIKPYEQVGKMKFGMKREEVRSLLGEFKEFRKTKSSINTTDSFGNYHIFYDKNDIFEAIEIFEEDQVVFENKNILEMTLEEAKSFLKQSDDNLVVTNDSIVSNTIGLSIYAPNDEIESILVFSKDYF